MPNREKTFKIIEESMKRRRRVDEQKETESDISVKVGVGAGELLWKIDKKT
jgi:hypothetical protein